MQQPARPRAFALALALVPLTAACGGDDKGSGFSASGGSTSVTTATAGTTESTGDASSTMSEPTGTGTSGSASGTSGEPTTGGSTGTESGTTADATTTTGSSSEPGTSGTTAADKVPCDSEETEVLPVPPSVLLILDKSGSMSMEVWDHDEMPQTVDVTRWYSLHQVVESVVTKFDAVVHFGVKLFPKIDAGSFVNQGACIVNDGVEVPIAPMNAQNVLAGIPAIDFEVLGGTPMETGLKIGYTYLKGLDPATQRFAILVADGEISDTCPGENFLEALDAVEQTYIGFGVPTYVVGVDVDASTSEQLASLALVGGKPKPGPEPFYQTKNQLELDAAIEQIVKDTLSCVIAVDPAPSEPELFEVEIDGQPVAQAADCAGDGWVWTNEFSEIELCGAACDMLKETGKVKALYFCKPG